MPSRGDRTVQMESVRLAINQHMTSVVGEDILCVLEKQSALVRVFVLERLSAAAEWMCNLFQREIETLEALLDHQSKLLDMAFNVETQLHTAEEKSCRGEAQEEPRPPQHEERSSSLVQEKPEPPQHEERRSSLVQEEPEPPHSKEPKMELLHRPEEADGSTMTMTGELLPVKSKDDDDESRDTEPPQREERSSSLLQTEPGPPHIKEEQEEVLLYTLEDTDESSLTLVEVKSEDEDDDDDTEPGASTSTQHMETEDCGTSQPTRDDQLPSESVPGDGDEWESAVNTLMSLQTQRDEGQTTSLSDDSSTKKSFCCTYCGKRFSRQGNLTKHTRIHTGEKPLTCTVCGKGCFEMSHLKQHMMTHSGEKPFSCTICGKGFIQKVNLKRHMRSHTGEKPFKCTVCEQIFGESHHLKRHMKTHTVHEEKL